MGIVVNRTRLNPFPIKSASGEFISIDDAVNRPVKKLEISFAPQQDLHGYSYPWVGGSGKNLCPDKKYKSSSNALYVGQDNDTDFPFSLTGGTTYTLSFSNPNQYTVNVYIREENTSSGTQVGTNVVGKCTFTPSTSGNYRIAITKTEILESDISNVQLELGSTVTTFMPYANICPITGYTECYLAKSNQNLLPSSTPSNVITGTLSSGRIANATNARLCAVPVPKNATICVQKLAGDRNTGNVGRVDTGDIKVGTPYYSSYGLTNATAQNVTTLTHPWLLIESSPRSNLDAFFNTRQLMISPGTGRKTYVAPSQDYQLIQVSWQTEAGEVFGGTLDLLTGVLTANWILVTFDGTESWVSYSSGTKRYFRHSLGAYRKVVVSGQGMCNIYPWYDITGTNTGVGFRVISSSSFNADLVNIRPDNVDGMTATIFKGMLADWYANGAPCTVAYKMKNPVTYQLDSHQISTLMGSNRIWTDVGTISLDYRAMRSAQNTPLLGGMLGNPVVPEEEPIEEMEE